MAKISLIEWAKREGITESRARQKARAGMLETAEKIGRNWVIDESEVNMDNRVKDENIYYVIESFKGNESIIFAGTKKECYIFEDEARAELIRANGPEVTTVNDFYVQSKTERERIKNRDISLKEYAKTLTKEELEEVVEKDGKKYAKWILDFDKKYNK